MATQEQSVADIRSESFPDYGHVKENARIEDSYLEGYDPVSLTAPHSSLVRTSTWVSMGLILSSLFGLGIFVWGAAASIVGWGAQTQDYSNILLVLGGIQFVVSLVLAWVLLAKGRKPYKEYKQRTGRYN